MTPPGARLPVQRCDNCHSMFLPRPGPCPRCGSLLSHSYDTPATGRVLASTEVLFPPSGWDAPHRLALVECADSVRVLAYCPDALPAVGSWVVIELKDQVYRARPTDPPQRGEGDFPEAGVPTSL